MRRRLRRYVAVGLISSIVDVCGYLLLREAWGVVRADVAALALAALVSYLLHRAFTLKDDPHERWIHQIGVFVPVVVLAGLVDLVTVVSLDGAVDAPLVAKLAGVALAAVVRAGAHRSLLFRVVRREQDAPSRRTPPPGEFRLTVVVPAYKEAGRIGSTVSRLRAEQPAFAARDVEIIVVDDGSGDATADEARAAGADQVLVQPHNRGKGAAVRAGMLAARGRTVVFTDADLAYAPAQIAGLVERIEAGWDVVVGNRRHVATSTLVRARRVREVGGRLINLATHALLLGQYRDTQCGLKAFRGDVARLIFRASRLDGFAFDIEVFHMIERHNLSLAELPVTVENSERSTVKVARDGLRLVADILRVRWWAREGRYNSDSSELPARQRD